MMRTYRWAGGVVLAVMAFCGCNDPKVVSGPEFMSLLNRNPESMRSTASVGVRDGMAVLKVSEMSLVSKSRWNETFFVTPATNLPKDFAGRGSASTP